MLGTLLRLRFRNEGRGGDVEGALGEVLEVRRERGSCRDRERLGMEVRGGNKDENEVAARNTHKGEGGGEGSPGEGGRKKEKEHGPTLYEAFIAEVLCSLARRTPANGDLELQLQYAEPHGG